MFKRHILYQIIAFVATACSLTNLHAQWKVETDDLLIKKELSATYQNKSLAMQAVYNAYSHLIAAGYLDARLDTIAQDSLVKVLSTRGAVYELRSVKWAEDSSTTTIGNIGGSRKPKAFDLNLLNSNIENTLKYYENHGYPFASAHVATLKIENNRADIKMVLERGPSIVLDSLIIRSEDKLPLRYVRNYLDIKKNQYYDEEKIKTIDRKLREIPFLQINSPTEIRFKPGEADIYLFLKKKKANYFNGIVGVRPDDITGKINITGDAEIKLVNPFNSGEELYINWRKLQSQTQDLSINTTLPYLFSSPIGVDGQLKIYKRDTSFTSVKASFGLVFALGGLNYMKAFVERNTTNQLATYNTGQPLANVNATLYGLAGHFEKLDYRFNPRKGYRTTLQLATGFRTVDKRADSEPTTDNNGRYNLYRIEGELEYYIPVFKRQAFRMATLGSTFITEAIYDNEMYRIGGLRTIRGIDEESIYANSFAIASVEYRFLFEENSAFYLFFDQTWYEKKGTNQLITDTPFGFGAGVNFETNAGIFTFNYALAKQFDNPILVRNAKVSFGFRSIF